MAERRQVVWLQLPGTLVSSLLSHATPAASDPLQLCRVVWGHSLRSVCKQLTIIYNCEPLIYLSSDNEQELVSYHHHHPHKLSETLDPKMFNIVAGLAGFC